MVIQDLERDKEYRCCMCLHVRSGTLLWGMFQAGLHLAVIISMLIIIINPNAMHDLRKNYPLDKTLEIFPFPAAHNSMNKNSMPPAGLNIAMPEKSSDRAGEEAKMKVRTQESSKPFAGAYREAVASQDDDKNSNPYVIHLMPSHYRNTERIWSIFLTMLSFLFIWLLIQGVIFRQPSYLLPYFSLQVFDFVLTCLTIMGYMTYIPNVKEQKVINNSNVQHLDKTGAGLAIVSVAFLMLGMKAYLMGMVWSCYKYLVLYNRANGALIRPSALSQSSVNVRQLGQFAINMHDLVILLRRPWWRNGNGRHSTIDGAQTRIVVDIDGVRRADDVIDADSFSDNFDPVNMEPPKYEDMLKRPANANMPPPYFTDVNPTDSNVANTSGLTPANNAAPSNTTK